MRLPLVISLDSRDGSANKDARQTNVLAEDDEGGALACVRPGLQTLSTATGVGSGLTCFGGVAISVFGTTLGYGETPTTVATVATGDYDFCQSPP